ncbi:hypothetical protein SFRURICE_007617 [Spodoptera frugiperda]|nr:hypothetical protein SFRURICE_007617 [Spodoptera frugiperda]
MLHEQQSFIARKNVRPVYSNNYRKILLANKSKDKDPESLPQKNLKSQESFTDPRRKSIAGCCACNQSIEKLDVDELICRKAGYGGNQGERRSRMQDALKRTNVNKHNDKFAH